MSFILLVSHVVVKYLCSWIGSTKAASTNYYYRLIRRLFSKLIIWSIKCHKVRWRPQSPKVPKDIQYTVRKAADSQMWEAVTRVLSNFAWKLDWNDKSIIKTAHWLIVSALKYMYKCFVGFGVELPNVCSSSLCWVGAGAAEGGVDATPHLHRGNVQHHRRARHGGVERHPPQNRDDVQLVGPRLPRPQLFGQCSVWAGLSGRDWGLPQTSRRWRRGRQQQQLGHSSELHTLPLTADHWVNPSKSTSVTRWTSCNLCLWLS